ncbi:MAG: hypothetical protein NTW06_03685 [Candidatus Falkowbacteria bacterium]|nr:hypothetical protein [Candidatus Falkowbacteria bacterium]
MRKFFKKFKKLIKKHQRRIWRPVFPLLKLAKKLRQQAWFLTGVLIVLTMVISVGVLQLKNNTKTVSAANNILRWEGTGRGFLSACVYPGSTTTIYSTRTKEATLQAIANIFPSGNYSSCTSCDCGSGSCPYPLPDGCWWQCDPADPSYGCAQWRWGTNNSWQVCMDGRFVGNGRILVWNWDCTGYYYNAFSIIASIGPNGSILPSGNVIVDYGEDKTFLIFPNLFPLPGYHIDTVTVDTVLQVPAPSSYTFTNVIANHTISATFAPNITHPALCRLLVEAIKHLILLPIPVTTLIL